MTQSKFSIEPVIRQLDLHLGGGSDGETKARFLMQRSIEVDTGNGFDIADHMFRFRAQDVMSEEDVADFARTVSSESRDVFLWRSQRTIESSTGDVITEKPVFDIKMLGHNAHRTNTQNSSSADVVPAIFVTVACDAISAIEMTALAHSIWARTSIAFNHNDTRLGWLTTRAPKVELVCEWQPDSGASDIAIMSRARNVCERTNLLLRSDTWESLNKTLFNRAKTVLTKFCKKNNITGVLIQRPTKKSIASAERSATPSTSEVDTERID